MVSKKEFRVSGIVCDKETKEGICGLQVEAWDKDKIFDDHLGKAITDEEGRFTIEFEASRFSKGYWERKPDIYFKIFCDIDLVFDSKHSVLWNAGHKTDVKLLVPFERWRGRVPCKGICDIHKVFLKIERLPAYSPAEPNGDAHGMYRRDCFRNPGHEDTVIPDTEVDLRRLDAVVYREYTDATFTTLKTDKLIQADILEPPAETRVPGTVIYTKPGERLCICVFNCDEEAHSLHVHGLAYGIDSDGAYPFGITSNDGRRSDEICPGETWVYEFEVREDMVGCWPFHSHYRHVHETTNKGLFGGIVVRDPCRPAPDHEVPFFMHRMVGERATSVFDSGTLQPGESFAYSFPTEGLFDYFCRFHPMFGEIEVVVGAPAAATVQILDSPPRFEPTDIQIAPGGTITWENNGNQAHTVTEQSGGGALESFCINGRVYEGNTPRIVAESGERVRWYVFNLDFGMDWHNFHTHAQRWKWGDEYLDTRSIGPAESFVVDTVVPDVLLPLCHKPKPKEKKKELKLCADFPVHCHVDPHMMQGMTATLRAIQKIELTPSQIECLGLTLPEVCSRHGCPEVDLTRCQVAGTGHWEELPDSEVFAVHGALLNSGRVLLFSGRAEVYHLPADYPLESRLFDPATNTQTSQSVGENLFCAGHCFLPDGRLLVAGGDRPSSGASRIASTHVFDPTLETWTKLPNDMNFNRWYPTVLTLSDGRIFAASGSGGSNTMEIFDPGTEVWTQVAGANKDFNGYYPSLHLLPNGEIFFSRTSWSNQSGTTGARLQFTGANSGTWTDMATMAFPDRQEGASVIMIDASVSPAATRIYVAGGGVAGALKNPQSLEMIDVTATVPTPSWIGLADMNFPRTNVTCVVLPDGKILAVGGPRGGKWAADPDPVFEAEIYDPAGDSWTVTPPMTHPRQYHSVVVLLPDGRVLVAGGIDPTLGGTPQRDQRSMEMFYPPYLSAGPQPTISNVASSWSYGASIEIETPEAVDIASVAMIMPNSVTHHTDGGHRYIKLGITGVAGDRVTVQAPGGGAIAPPGFYMLYIVTTAGVPSVASWVQIS
jgi:plastocyanin